MVVDLPLGPNQGQGVPAPYDSQGKAWDLQVFQTTLGPGDEFNQVLDGWGTGPLQAAVVGGFANGGNSIDESTLQDYTSATSPDGSLSFTLPSTPGYSYTLFSAYLIHSQWQAQDSPPLIDGPQSTPQNWIQNGSWAVDHFSSLGAEWVIQFWNEHLLDNSTKGLLRQVGQYWWEDSLEIVQNVKWTRDLLETFQEQHGYDLRTYLPVILGHLTTEFDGGYRYIHDYETTVGFPELLSNAICLTGPPQLTAGYGQYLETLTNWTHESLGAQFSAQVSYGFPMDMLANIPKVDVPEDESLEFGDNIDEYRQYAGPAHLAGKLVISNELGAEPDLLYQDTLPQLLRSFKRCVAGGVNQVVIHGMPYSGPYGNTTWPGFMTFEYSYSAAHNRQQPAWDFYPDAMNFMARNNFVFQTGTPRRDIAFWLKAVDYLIGTSYDESDLIDTGTSIQSHDAFANT